jgi:SAM-dependent methyltransferase
MFQQFMTTVRPLPSDLVLDVGVTPDDSLKESNFFELLYPYRDRITASSIEDASNLTDRFPGVTFVRTDGLHLPFPDSYFDIGFSSAVIEHVGDANHQREFISELLRVAKRVYVLTPNRWFPIELHTMLPLVHWLPQARHQRLLSSLGLEFWARTENLNLLSARDLRALFPSRIPVRIMSLRTFGWPSNLIAYAEAHSRE